MKLVLVFLTLNLFLIKSAIAVKGVNVFEDDYVKKRSCLILGEYEGVETQGVCSGTLVDAKTILTAKHCLLKAPSLISSDLYEVNVDLLDISELSISCNDQPVKINKLVTSDSVDVAKIVIQIITK